MSIDLHCHTTASDGVLSPVALVERAQAMGVKALSITDHDTVDAYRMLPRSPDGLVLIPGVEFSTRWKGVNIHVVGLDVDLDSPALAEALARQAAARESRAEMIARTLEKQGFTGVLAGAQALADGGVIGRPHFARYLVESGQVSDHETVFRRWLGAGKPGDVKAMWPPLDTIVAEILAAGGVPVLAHPQHYKMTATKLRTLLGEFKLCGGQAVELPAPGQGAQIEASLIGLARVLGLALSPGSDFHGPGAFTELGRTPVIRAGSVPVWSLFSASRQQALAAQGIA